MAINDLAHEEQIEQLQQALRREQEGASPWPRNRPRIGKTQHSVGTHSHLPERNPTETNEACDGLGRTHT